MIMPSRIRIFLADDEIQWACLLRLHLATYEQFDFVGSALTTEAALKRVGELEVDVLLLDIRMGQLNGLEALNLFRRTRPGMKIVVMTSLPPKESELQTIKAGADGYVYKAQEFSHFASDLIQAVEMVTRGKMFFDLAVWRNLDPMLQEIPAQNPLQPTLSPREREVLLLIAEGLTSKEIAARFDLSKKTVDKHRQRIMEKLQIRGTASLTKYAISAGLTAGSK
jgi:DNA-binding NarL/FixJ family response regulator